MICDTEIDNKPTFHIGTKNTVIISTYSTFKLIEFGNLWYLFWVESSLPKTYVEILTPRTCESDLISKRVFADVIKFR